MDLMLRIRNFEPYSPTVPFYPGDYFLCRFFSQGQNSPRCLPISDFFFTPFCLSLSFFFFFKLLQPVPSPLTHDSRPWGRHESGTVADGHLVSLLTALHTPKSDGVLYQGFESWPMGWGHLAYPALLQQVNQLSSRDHKPYSTLLRHCSLPVSSQGNNSALFLPIYD